jgi:hypothetical protein
MADNFQVREPRLAPIRNDFMNAPDRWNGPRLNLREAVALAHEELRLKRKLTADERDAVIAKLN